MAKRSNRQVRRDYGIYSPFISASDARDLEKMKRNEEGDELAYARTRLKAAQQALEKAGDDELRMKWDHACRGWMQVILASLDRNARRSTAGGVFLATFLEAMRAANEAQGWN